MRAWLWPLQSDAELSDLPTRLTGDRTRASVSDMTTRTGKKPTTRVEVEEIILSLLAEREGIPSGALRVKLEGGGSGMPIGSLKTVAIVVELEARLDIELPNDKETGNALRSVTRLAEVVLELIKGGN